MKKEYTAPVAEIMEFDYEDNVVASGTSGTYITTGSPWVGNTGKGQGKTGCVKYDKC